jgi:hypothetical protein
MNARAAAELLNIMTHKPGYEVTAEPLDDHRVILEMWFPSHDSTPSPDGSHRAGRFGSPVVILDTAGLDAEGVTGLAVMAIDQVETHETREFYRVAHGIAPFHPHNRSGEAAWKRIQNLKDRVRVLYPAPNGA